MKKHIFKTALAFFLLNALNLLAPAIESHSVYRNFQLGNGLKVFLRQNSGNPLVNMVMAIDLGSKDETATENGWVHLLEHLLLSSGTGSFRKEDLIGELRKRGCYINAHTDHDLMTMEISTTPENAGFALDLLKEKIFNSAFTDQDLDNEKHVILEEINQIQEDPWVMGASLALGLLFPHHPYGNPIHGDREIVKNTTLDQIRNFSKPFCRPSNCSLAVVGGFPLPELENRIKGIFEVLDKTALFRYPISPPEPMKNNLETTLELEIDQAYLILGFRAPELGHEDQFAFDVLNHILGKGSNPLLGYSLHSRKKIIASFFTRYFALKHGGAFLVNMVTDAENIFLLKREVSKFLNRSDTFNYSKKDFLEKDQLVVTDYLESARNLMRLNSEQFKEQGMNSAISFARFMLVRTDSRPYNYREKIEKIQSSDLKRVAAKYLCRKKTAVIYILPKKKNA